MDLVEATLLVIIANNVFYVYTRTVNLSRFQRAKTKLADGHLAGVAMADSTASRDRLGETKIFSRKRILDFLANEPCSVTCFRRVDGGLLVVGFSNGNIGVYACDLTSSDATLRQGKPLVFINAHRTDDFHPPPRSSSAKISGGVISIAGCSWPSVVGGAYLSEFLTVGVDNRLVHWGLRRVTVTDDDSPQSGTPFPMPLGDFTEISGALKTQARATPWTNPIAADLLGVSAFSGHCLYQLSFNLASYDPQYLITWIAYLRSPALCRFISCLWSPPALRGSMPRRTVRICPDFSTPSVWWKRTESPGLLSVPMEACSPYLRCVPPRSRY